MTGDRSRSDIELHLVSHDPDVLAELRSRGRDLGAIELARYAHALGLFPPGYRSDVRYGIITACPSADVGDDGLLLWDTSSFGDEPDADRTRP